MKFTKGYILITTILINACLSICNAQVKLPIKFTYQYKKNDPDNVRLIVENLSGRTYYYTIGVEGLTDTGWVGLNADINSIGQNDFLVLKPIKKKTRIIKDQSKKKVLFAYDYVKPKKIRFCVTYFEKQDVRSKLEEIYLPPI